MNSMLDLEIELIVVLIIIAIIGIIMGRFLCKSGEKEVREEKKKVVYAHKKAQHQIGIYENQIEKKTSENHQLESQLSDLKQKYSNAQTALSISDNQREKLLKDLKIFEKYKSRFEALQDEFKLHNRLVDELKGQKIKNLEKIGELESLKSNQEKSIENLNKKYQESNSEIARLEALIKEKNLSTEELELKLKEKYKAIIEEKESLYEKLEEEKNRAYKDTIQDHRNTMEALKEEHTTSYIELKKEKERIEDEYETFKLNFNFDSDRLASLERDYEKMYNTLNSIIGERDDLISRLRAISSVVGAVSVEKHEHIYQPLLEDNSKKDKK